jgi:hypothetical protein
MSTLIVTTGSHSQVKWLHGLPPTMPREKNVRVPYGILEDTTQIGEHCPELPEPETVGLSRRSTRRSADYCNAAVPVRKVKTKREQSSSEAK